VRQDKQKWADRKAVLGEQLQAAMKDAFAHFRELRAACPQISSPIIDENDNLVSDKEGKTACWPTINNKPPATPTEDLISVAASAEEDPDNYCDEPSLPN